VQQGIIIAHSMSDPPTPSQSVHSNLAPTIQHHHPQLQSAFTIAGLR
jgi:hypothetical protein